MATVSTLVLRDLAHAALQKQPCPITTTEVAEALSRFWTGDIQHIQRVLRELEASGLAVRETGPGARPGGGQTPNRWTAAR